MTPSQTAARLVSIALAVLTLAGPAASSTQAKAKAKAKAVPQLAFLNRPIGVGLVHLVELRTVGADGRRERTIAKGATGPVPVVGSTDQPFGGPAWSPDGTAIAWGQATGALYTYLSELRVARPDGTNGTTLLSIPGLIEEVHWAPDGRRLAFVLRTPNPAVIAATWTDAGDRRDIYLINKDGSELKAIAPIHARYVGGLDFSPDGSKLAFASDGQGLQGIYTVGLDGASVPARLTPLDMSAGDPRWSPDASSVAFIGTPLLEIGLNVPGLWTIKAEGSEPRKLDARILNHPPSWSPDGRWLAYARASRSGIGTIRADGSIKRTLTSAEDFWPVWSRTGRIAFIREMLPDSCCERALWVMDADGSDARRVSAASDVIFDFAWSR